MRPGLLICSVMLVSIFSLDAACAGTTATGPDIEHGRALYTERCAICHDHPGERVPQRKQLQTRSPETVLGALTGGVMMRQAVELTLQDKQSLTLFLTGKLESSERPAPDANRCGTPASAVSTSGPAWRNWGVDVDNGRYQPVPGMTAADVPRLSLAWAFAYPGDTVYGQPAVAGDRVFVSSHAGLIFSLDAGTGCTHWVKDIGSPARAGIVIAQTDAHEFTAFIGDDGGVMHALDAQTGAERWFLRMDSHIAARLTGSPVFHEGRLYVTVSSAEEGFAMREQYPCCTFRGSVSAVDARTGRLLWKSYVVAEPNELPGSHPGKARFGPAGGAIWSPPTIDEQRGELFVATGNSYTDVDAIGTDAVVAFDLATGAHKWTRQLTERDNFIGGCGAGTHGGDGHNCPDELGGDWDFGAPPILRELSHGRRVLLAPQKSGVLWALDPDREGAVIWSRKLGQSAPVGGLVWGSAADRTHVYAGYNGDADPAQDVGPNGVAALDIASGQILWNVLQSAPASCGWGTDKCTGGIMQAVTAIPGVVFAGAIDAHLRAYDARTGRIIWDYDTFGEYPAVNGAVARGGSLAQGGAVVAGGRLFVNSGYAPFYGRPGNALLVFSVAGPEHLQHIEE